MSMIQTVVVGSIAVFVIPCTLFQQKKYFRHSLMLLAIACNSVASYLSTKITNEVIFSTALGILYGFSQSVVIAFPLLKIRNYFTQFEKKMFFSGLLLCANSCMSVLSIYIIQSMDFMTKGTESDILGYKIYNVIDLF